MQQKKYGEKVEMKSVYFIKREEKNDFFLEFYKKKKNSDCAKCEIFVFSTCVFRQISLNLGKFL